MSRRVTAPCGTYAAARRHERLGEPVCDACARARREYQAEAARRYRARRAGAERG